jgi:pyranose oxidase
MAVDVLSTDVLVAGGGPAGCTFARVLADSGRTVLVIDAGGQHSRRPGEHLKNAAIYQRNIDSFTPIVQGMLQRLSLPSQAALAQCSMLDPISFRPDPTKKFKRQSHNPEQSPAHNLDAAAVSYGIGGMFTHWTNNTPRYHQSERSALISDDDWNRLYDCAEDLLDVHSDVFDRSLRQKVVGEVLTDLYGRESSSQVRPLPVAGHRRKRNPEFVCYTGCDTILGSLLDDEGTPREPLQIREHNCLRRLVTHRDRVEYAEVEDLMSCETFRIEAEEYVVAAGALLTPQILWASEIDAPALGEFLTEHPLAFTQVVLRRELVERIGVLAQEQGSALDAEDAVPIPAKDPPPMLMIGVTNDRPWHCQIHRDSFAYGAVPDEIDDRLIADLRWFGMTEPRRENRIHFSRSQTDFNGMPKPIFEFEMSAEDRHVAHEMMSDMIRAAGALGGFLPGSEPKFMPAGTSLHFMGTTRIAEDAASGVTDSYSRVWGYDNLRLAGNGMIPTATASNPSLTMVAIALRSACDLIGIDVPPKLRSRVGARS